MKRRITVAMASVIMTSMVVPIAEPIFADEVVSTMTAQQFIDTYLSKSVIDETTQGIVLEVYTSVDQIDATNYTAVLNSECVYNAMSQELKDEINSTLVAKSQLNYESFLTKAKEIQTQIQQEQAAQETTEPEQKEEVQQPETSQDVQTTEEPKTEEVSETENVQEEVVTPQESTDVQENTETTEDATTEQTVTIVPRRMSLMRKAVATTQEPEVSVQTQTEEQVSADTEELISTENLEEATQQEIVVEAKTEVEEPVILSEENVQEASTKSTDETKAETFVEKHMTSSSGQVYQEANTRNYQNIVAGISDWNQLSTVQKAKVNTILTNASGKTYQTMLQEAQNIQAVQTNTNRVSVQTGVQSQAGIHSLLCLLSAVVAGFLFAGKSTKH